MCYLLYPLVFPVVLAGVVVGGPVVFVMKRVGGWDPVEGNDDEQFVTLFCGAVVVAVGGIAGVLWLVS